MTILLNWRINLKTFSVGSTVKNISCLVFFASILVQPTAARAVDYNNFGAYCQALEKQELEFIRMEVAKGYMTEEEAAEEIEYIPELEQCICFFQKALESAGSDFTLQLQKLWLESYTVEELAQMEDAENPEGMDIEAVMDSNAIACGFNME